MYRYATQGAPTRSVGSMLRQIGVGALDTQAPNTPYTTLRRWNYRGVEDSIGGMRQMVFTGQSHPTVRRWAEGVVRRVLPKDYLSELAAIYYAVCREMRYTRDPANTELIHHPALVIERRAGDCDDQAVLIRASAAAASIGNPIEFAVVGFRDNVPPTQRYTHVFARAYDERGKQWVVLDPVAGPDTAKMLSRVRHFRAFPV